MTRFADADDAGRALVALLTDAPADAVVLAVVPNGVPAALVIAESLGLPVGGVRLERDGDPHVTHMPPVSGRPVVVVDDGVETGTAARLVSRRAREDGATRVTLAVPVCPREAEAVLRAHYDDIVAVERPLVRRSLQWHYDSLEMLDETEADRRIAESGRSLE